MMLKKKMVSVLLAVAMVLGLGAPAFAAENEESYLEKVKQDYLDNLCFYQVTDTEYLDSLADEDVIEVFHNIKVSKRLLDDNMILDIDKVKEDDIVPEYSAQSANVRDTEVRHTLSSFYDNVVVIKTATMQQGWEYAGASTQITYAYLSNNGIDDYAWSNWEDTAGKALIEIIQDWVASTAMGAIDPVFGAVLSLIAGLGGTDRDGAFRDELHNYYLKGYKAIVMISVRGRSCERWTDNYYYTEDASRDGVDITSSVDFYHNLPRG